MLLFLLCYLAIYGGAHAWLLLRVVRCFGLGAPVPAALTALGVFMVAAPILVRILEHRHLEVPAKIVAYLGYLWMGFFFLFLSATIGLDVLRLLLAWTGWLTERNLVPGEPQLLGAALLLALAGSLYGYFEARQIRVERVTLKSSKLPAGERLRIVQVSDVHLGLMVGEKRLARILALVRAEKPDLLVSTGDLVDGQRDGLQDRDQELSALQLTLGKFAVLGNHEVIAGLDHSIAFTEQAGFRLLRNEWLPVGDRLALAGVDDPALPGGGDKGAEARLLAAVPQGRFVLLLKHRPKVEEASQGRFDLQLSGHVHKGQIFPFNLITHFVYPAKLGLSEAGAGSHLYVSRGTGTWGPPIRVFAPPEVTVFDIVSSETR
ncbi:serine/threonine phosphatase [Geomonas limicola]|uniref:Serine/threonine phosphatase n=1 Tax=Geomonas limicola TaxID=2740186 RepID=A0A6V8NDW8_9BACT|nr:metallophosphoesterase [Geomonas limicola]GFO70736.1 serine/threonine phosphatase [Geomonas limicola]